MGAMPGNIAKGPILEKFDQYVNEERSHLEELLLFYLNTTKTVAQVVGQGRTRQVQNGPHKGNAILSSQDEQHVKDHWLAELLGPATPKDKGWWPTFRPMGEVLRRGLVQALALCDRVPDPNKAPKDWAKRPAALPLDSYWVCAGHHFELVSAVGQKPEGAGKNPEDHHVLLLILTPSLPISRRVGTFGADENIWVTRPSAVSPGEARREEDLAKQVEVVRLKTESS